MALVPSTELTTTEVENGIVVAGDSALKMVADCLISAAQAPASKVGETFWRALHTNGKAVIRYQWDRNALADAEIRDLQYSDEFLSPLYHVTFGIHQNLVRDVLGTLRIRMSPDIYPALDEVTLRMQLNGKMITSRVQIDMAEIARVVQPVYPGGIDLPRLVAAFEQMVWDPQAGWGYGPGLEIASNDSILRIFLAGLGPIRKSPDGVTAPTYEEETQMLSVNLGPGHVFLCLQWTPHQRPFFSIQESNLVRQEARRAHRLMEARLEAAK